MAQKSRRPLQQASPDPLRGAAEAVLPGKAPPRPAPGPRARSGRRPAREEKGNPAVRLLHVLGPGLITGASDDDPSGIGTYVQAGSQFGLATLWTALFTFPFMVAVQDTCARVALRTGVGLATSLRRRFPTSLVAACVLALLIANTINVGADIQAVAAGASLLTNGAVPPIWFVAPVTIGLLAMLVRLHYHVIVRTFKWLTLALFAYVFTTAIIRPSALPTLQATFVPHVQLDVGFIGILVAILGTTISPYLFFWQASSEVDVLHGRSRRRRVSAPQSEFKRARVDVFVGMFFSQVVMYCIIVASAVVLHDHGQTSVQTAAQAARALAPLAGSLAFVVFSVGIVGAGLLAIPVLAGSAAYAVKEFFGLRGSLADDVRRTPTLYLVMAVAMAGGLTLTFLHINPIQALIITAIINGLIAPPILALITILARDPAVMGEHRSGRLRHTLLWIITAVMAAAAAALLITTVWHP